MQLNGEGFELLVNKGDTVKRGQGIVRWDPAAVEAAGKSADLPGRGAGGHGRVPLRRREDGDVKAGDSSSAGSDATPSAGPIGGDGSDNHRGGVTRRTIGDG